MHSFLRASTRAPRRFLRLSAKLFRGVVSSVARRRRWQLVATLMVGLLLGAGAVGLLGFGAGSGAGHHPREVAGQVGQFEQSDQGQQGRQGPR